MDPKELEKMAQQAMNISGKNPSPQDMMNSMGTLFQRLEYALAETSKMTQMVGQSTDIAQLTIHMLVKLLIEKGLVSEDEIKERYKAEVEEAYKKMQEEAYAAMKQQMEKQIEEKKKEQEKDTFVVMKDAEKMVSNVVPLKKPEDESV